MAVGKKITELSKAVKTNLSSDGTLVYVVNNNVSKQVDLDNLLFDGIITSNKIAANAITAREITGDVLRINGDRIDNLSTSLGNVSTNLGNAITSITSLSATLNGLEDGGINTFYQESAPTGVIGDLWFNTSTDKLTRWDGSNWITIEDAGITTAISAAAAAANVADNKITTYYNDNPPTTDLIDNDPLDALDTGDLWFDTNDNNKLYRWSGTEWISVQDGQISSLSTSLGDAITNITSITNTLNGLEDGAINTFYQTTAPTTGTIGDLWFNTTTNKLTRYNGSTWITIEDAGIATAISDAAAAANVADNKITTYFNDTAPTVDSIDGDALDELDTGDLWFDTNDNNKLYRWSGSAWVVVQDTSIQTNIYTTNTTTIDGGKITAASISANQIAANTITAAKIAANTITANKIAANSITVNQIAANSITANEIAANSVAAAQIQSGAITAQAISSNIVITGSIQSRNFDGFNAVSQTGEEILQYLDSGTQGFFLDERTGTAVFTSIIARDNIISANYIKYNANSGLSAIDADGNFGINLDNETLQIQDGRVMIKQIPSNSVIDESLYLTQNTVFFGQANTEIFALPPITHWNTSAYLDTNTNQWMQKVSHLTSGSWYGDLNYWWQPMVINNELETGAHVLIHIDLFDYVDSVDQIVGAINLNNIKFKFDLSNYRDINYITSFYYGVTCRFQSTLNYTDSYRAQRTVWRNTVSSPTLVPREYEFSVDIQTPNVIPGNNTRYLSIYLDLISEFDTQGMTAPSEPQDVTQYITVSAEFNTDTNLRFEVMGAVPADRIHSLSEINKLIPGSQMVLVMGNTITPQYYDLEWSSLQAVMDPGFKTYQKFLDGGSIGPVPTATPHIT